MQIYWTWSRRTVGERKAFAWSPPKMSLTDVERNCGGDIAEILRNARHFDEVKLREPGPPGPGQVWTFRQHRERRR